MEMEGHLAKGLGWMGSVTAAGGTLVTSKGRGQWN